MLLSGKSQVEIFKMMGFKSKNLLQSQVTRVSQEQRLEDWLGLFEAASREKCIMIMEPFPWRSDFRSQLFLFSSQLKQFSKKDLLESCTTLYRDVLVATKELVGVIGRVGSGKTTFLQTIIGELYPLPCLGGSRGRNATSP